MEPTLIPRWLAKDDPANPFNVGGFDCLRYVNSLRATTQDEKIAESFLSLRKADGVEYQGKLPEPAVEIECDLRYAYPGEVAEGMLFKSSQMEEKWDIYLYGDRIYFCRSWTGALVFVARFSATGSEIVISHIWAASEAVEPESHLAVLQVDYLIKNHLFGRPVPHPLPESVPHEPEAVGAYSFAQYGNKCCFGSYEDTTTAGLKNRAS
jgi:hypothetical protein